MRSLLLFVLGALCGAIAMLFSMTQPSLMPGVDETAARSPPTAMIAHVSNPASTPTSATITPIASDTVAAPEPVSTTQPIRAESDTGANPATSGSPSPQELMIPVEGIHVNQLTDTFGDARAAGRTHDAIDIMAPKGTRVFAASDGKVVKLFASVRGGLTVYEFDPGATFAYYYAHLDSYAPGLVEGKQLARGDLIGFVGSSGDASPSSPHLHFAIFVLGPEKHWWQGSAINPYPILTGHPLAGARPDTVVE